MRAITWLVPFALVAVLTFCIAATILPNYYRGVAKGRQGNMPYEETVDLGPFRMCQNIKPNNTEKYDGCSRINPNCKADFDVSGLENVEVPGCTEFNVARGFLILSILFAAFSIALIIFALIRRDISTGRTVRFAISATSIVLTTAFLLVSVISTGVHYKNILQSIEDRAASGTGGGPGVFVIQSHEETLGNSFILVIVSFVAALASSVFFIYFGRTKNDAESVDYAYLQY